MTDLHVPQAQDHSRRPTVVVYAAIGNSDNRLSQRQWADYCRQFVACFSSHADVIYGNWYSLPNVEWQNAAIVAKVQLTLLETLKRELAWLRERHHQDSMAFGIVEVEMI